MLESATKRIVIAFILFGLGTFFLPIFTIDPPVLGRADWSASDILALVRSGSLSVERGLFDADMIRLWMTYVLLVVGLALFWLPQYHKPLSIFAGIGLYASDRVIQHGHYEFGVLFESMQLGWHHGVIAYKPTIYVLPGILVILLFFLASEFKRS